MKEVGKTGKKLTSAQKAARAAERKRQRNRSVKSAVGTALSKAETSLQEDDREGAEARVRQAVRTLDRAAGKGVIHPNKAARRKSRLMKGLKAVASPGPQGDQEPSS